MRVFDALLIHQNLCHRVLVANCVNSPDGAAPVILFAAMRRLVGIETALYRLLEQYCAATDENLHDTVNDAVRVLLESDRAAKLRARLRSKVVTHGRLRPRPSLEKSILM